MVEGDAKKLAKTKPFTNKDCWQTLHPIQNLLSNNFVLITYYPVDKFKPFNKMCILDSQWHQHQKLNFIPKWSEVLYFRCGHHLKPPTIIIKKEKLNQGYEKSSATALFSEGKVLNTISERYDILLDASERKVLNIKYPWQFSYRIARYQIIYREYEPITDFCIVSVNPQKRYIRRYIVYLGCHLKQWVRVNSYLLQSQSKNELEWWSLSL